MVVADLVEEVVLVAEAASADLEVEVVVAEVQEEVGS